jgi:hypothetical protein
MPERICVGDSLEMIVRDWGAMMCKDCVTSDERKIKLSFTGIKRYSH